jgi:phospholipid/cholesterol/gamma-HCH transport system permease protein
MTVALPSKLHPPLQRTKNAVVGGWNRIGSQMQFYVTTLGSIPDALVNYRSEALRLIAQMGLGTAALAMVGGTVVIVGFLTMTTGALVAVQGYNQLASVGIEALTGFASAYFNVRLIVPGTASVALSATIGAGATAQIGAMRINEEIDALEVIGIRSITYLASTRLIAGVVVVIPLYCIAVMMAFLASRAGTVTIYGQGSGVYDHYFNTFLSGRDIIWSFFQSVAITVVIMLVHTYYGYNASGVVAAVEIVMITLAVYGESGNFHLAS